MKQFKMELKWSDSLQLKRPSAIHELWKKNDILFSFAQCLKTTEQFYMEMFVLDPGVSLKGVFNIEDLLCS